MRVLKVVPALIVLVLSFPSQGQGFNFAAYQPSSIGELQTKWNGITEKYDPGVSVTQPQKVLLSAISASEPFSCNNQLLVMIHNTLGAQHILQRAPTSHCIKVKEHGSDPEIVVFIQDTLVSSYINEVAVGSPVDLYAVFLGYLVREDRSKNFPIFMANEFSPTNPAVQGTQRDKAAQRR